MDVIVMIPIPILILILILRLILIFGTSSSMLIVKGVRSCAVVVAYDHAHTRTDL